MSPCFAAPRGQLPALALLDLTMRLSGNTALLTVLSLLLFLTANAQEPESESAAVDERISERLTTIFENVDVLNGISVNVNDGVVRLTGTTTRSELRNKAEDVARSLEGVIYIDNDIEETVDVNERLAPRLDRFYELLHTIRERLPLFGVALLTLLVFIAIAKLAGMLYRRTGFLSANGLLKSLVGGGIKLVAILTGVYFSLEIMGATAVVGALLGAAGVAGLALSFAFRDIIENFLASIFLSLRQPFNLKDTVEIEGTQGKILRMTTSETVLLSSDGNHIRFPNADVFKGKIINFTRNGQRRFQFDVGIGADETISRAQEVGTNAMEQMKSVLIDPAPSCIVNSLGDSNIILTFYGWMDQTTHDFQKVRSNAIRFVKTAFDTEGIKMPAPIHEIFLHRQMAAADTASDPTDVTTEIEAIEEEDVAADSHLDEQIDVEIVGDKEVNLLANSS